MARGAGSAGLGDGDGAAGQAGGKGQRATSERRGVAW
jgi:hypothetical protein